MLASSYHQQQLPSPQQSLPPPPQTVSPTSTTLTPASDAPPQSADAPQQQQPPPPGTFQTLRLRDDQPPVVTSQPATAPRASRKRKSPPSTAQQEPPQMSQPPPGMHPPPPPPPGMMHGHFLPPPMPHNYQYVPGDYTPGGMPPPPPPPPQLSLQDPQGIHQGRQLSTSKRAEQNRKAQRAFRERRDQHVKALESRSQLLDAALASADEANRRWEDCRALVDQLRIENAALKVALGQAQMANGQPPSMPPPPGLEQVLAQREDASRGAAENPNVHGEDRNQTTDANAPAPSTQTATS